MAPRAFLKALILHGHTTEPFRLRPFSADATVGRVGII
jgi:hypothetical protein